MQTIVEIVTLPVNFIAHHPSTISFPHHLRSPLLLQCLTFGKSQPHPLSHFNIPFGTILNTRRFIFIKRFRTEGCYAIGKAFGYKVVVQPIDVFCRGSWKKKF
jgi:hypothetical protein